MSFLEPTRRRVTRRSVLLAGLALVTVVVAGCGALPEGTAGKPDQSVYRTQVTPNQHLDAEAFGATAEALEARLRFLADEGATVRQVRDAVGDFFLVEVPSADVPTFGSLVLTKGRVSLVELPVGATLDEPTPAGARTIVDDLHVEHGSVHLREGETGPTLEFVLDDRDARPLADLTDVPGRTLGVVVDGVVLLAAEVHEPIPAGQVSVASAERPEILRAIGALLASGPLGTDLAAAEGGQILFDK